MSALLVTGISHGFHAQDQLFKKDNTKIVVKVLEVGTTEIRYKMFDNLNGPTHIENKENVSLIIYQNGEHQVVSQSAAPAPAPDQPVTVNGNVVTSVSPHMTRSDSLIYYGHANSISLNFLNFFNNEIGILYRREFFSSNFNIVIPIAFGVSKPSVTQNIYFGRGGNYIQLGNKVMEGGFGIHYYPSLRSNTNYFIGPMVRYMQYTCTQYETGWVWPVNSNNTILNRWAFSLTNGFIYRTRSRLTTSLFASVGFKSDEVADPLTDFSGQPIVTIPNPLSFYWWSGFEVGFSF